MCVVNELLSVLNAIHIQMRVTKFGTETNARPPPGLRRKKEEKKEEKEERKEKRKALRLLLTRHVLGSF